MPNQILEKLGGGALLAPGGKPAVDMTALEGKTIALYFSAHWCPPCRGFTPTLAATYEAMRKSGREDFEFIFVSSDKSESQFNEYRNSMPWLALPFSKRAEKAALSELFGIRGIPALVTIAPDGTVINKSARGPATGDSKGANFPWAPQALGDLSTTVESLGTSINDAPALCVFLEGCDDAEQEEARAVLTAAANAAAAALKGSSGKRPPLLYFQATAGGGIVDQLRTMCGLGSAASAEGPCMVIVDIKDNGALYKSDATEITADTVKAFSDAFLNSKSGLTRLQLR